MVNRITKKGQQAGVLGSVPLAALSLVILAVVIGVGLTVLDEVQATQQTSGGVNETGAAFNATADGIAGLSTFSSFQPTIAVIVVAVVVIALLLGGFAFARGRQN